MDKDKTEKEDIGEKGIKKEEDKENRKDKKEKGKIEGNPEKSEGKKNNQEKNEEVESSEKEKIEKNKEKSEGKKEEEKGQEKDEEKESKGSKERIKHQEKILRNFLIILAGVFVLVFLGYYIANAQDNFHYKNLDFNKHREKELLFYHTTFPLFNSQGEQINEFNVYLRKDPGKTSKVDFDGEFELKRNMVINFSENFRSELECEGAEKGDSIIAIANIQNVFQNAGVNIITDPNASCDSQGRYVYLNIKTRADETMIKEYNDNCYNLYVKDCEILKGTERFLLEALVEMNRIED